jgi:hypothetical protein
MEKKCPTYGLSHVTENKINLHSCDASLELLKLWLESLKEKDYSEDLGVEGRNILK